MDELDRAQKEIMAATAQLISSAVGRTAPEVASTGYCLYCEEPLPDGRRWCDASCRDEWEKERKRRTNGK